MSLPGITSSLGAFGSAAAGGGGSGSLHDAAISSTGTGVRTCTYRLNADGKAYSGDNGAYSVLESWLVTGAAADYDARVTVIAGTLSSGTTGTWLNLGTTRDWALVDTTNDASPQEAEIFVEISLAATHVTIASATIAMSADRN